MVRRGMASRKNRRGAGQNSFSRSVRIPETSEPITGRIHYRLYMKLQTRSAMNTAKTYSRMRAVQATLLTAVLFAAAVGIFACKSNDSTTGAPEVTYITPNAPSSVTLIPLNASIVRLVWVESEKKVFTGFLIQRKQGISGVWTDLSRVGAAFRTYTDSNLVLDQYFYRIFTFNETAYSRPSFEVSVNTATVVV